MVRPLGLPRLAVGLALVPFAAFLAVACGGSDVVDPADTGLDTGAFAANSEDAPSSADATGSDSNRPDTERPDSAQSDADAPVVDAALLEADARADDADAGLRDSDAGPPDTGAGLRDADAGLLADVLREADAGLPDADATLPDADAGLPDSAVLDADGQVEADARFDAEAGDSGVNLLGSAKNFAVLAGSTITIPPAPPLTTIIGDVGVSPGTAIATLSPGQPV